MLFDINFDTSALNHPKMTLKSTRSILPIYAMQVFPEPQTSIRFSLRAAVFELQTILRQVHEPT